MSNQQIHKRLSKEQIITIFENYLAKEIKANEAQSSLGLKKSQFFNLVSKYKKDPDNFDFSYQRKKANNKINDKAEEKIIEQLELEKSLIDNRSMPVNSYNYTAIRDDLLEKHKVKISVPTIINRAKEHGYHLGKPPKRIHDREVLTNCVGELMQGDSSHHLWSPFMEKKLYLITYLDDYSRLILFAELFEKETAWLHIKALKSIFLHYGCPLKTYVDQHSIFRYVKERDKNRPWNDYSKFTDDTSPQWKQVLEECGVSVIYALSPQAKGKIERPYRWIQDRIVRTAAKEKLKTAEELRVVLSELIEKYNTKWIHSTTKEIPIMRFEKAKQENQSLFKALQLNADKTIDDVFCLRGQRVVNSYRKISLNGHELRVPNGVPRKTVDLKIAPDYEKQLVNIRIWDKNTFLGDITEKMENFKTLRF